MDRGDPNADYNLEIKNKNLKIKFLLWATDMPCVCFVNEASRGFVLTVRMPTNVEKV
jgi:hypothetical protein